jgi:hypothetical protein
MKRVCHSQRAESTKMASPAKKTWTATQPTMI